MASVTLPAVVLLAPFLFSTLQTPGSGKQHKDGMLHGRAANAHTARVKLQQITEDRKAAALTEVRFDPIPSSPAASGQQVQREQRRKSV